MLSEYIGVFQNRNIEREWTDRLSNYECSLTILYDQVAKLLRLIPSEKIVIPPLNVIGAAIESAKYQIEDEHLRDMFANLIASSMNSDKTELAHPTFVDIIKQLSPFDAQFLAQISSATVRNKNVKGVISDGLRYVVAQLRHYKRLNGLHLMEYTITKQTLKDFVFQDFNGTIDEYKHLLEQATLSLDNLTRLNLVTIREELSDTKYHQDFAKSMYMKDFVERIEGTGEPLQIDEHFETKVDHQWCSVKLTEFGIFFCDIVLPVPDEAET